MEARVQRDARAAQNQSLFREVNERLRELGDALGEGLPNTEFVCECTDESCDARVRVTHPDYEAVRAVPTRFIVAPGHVDPEVERVVDERPGFTVVEKLGEAGDLADELDGG